MDLRLALRSDDELRRLSRALSLSTQCHLYLAVVNAPSVAAPLCELLSDELSLSRKRSIVFERHAPEPTPEAIVTAIEWLDRQGALGRDGVRALDLSAIGDSNAPWLHTLFARLNESRNALYREPLSEILLVLAPGIEQVFHERAPDFWSIRSGVYPLLAATPADALDRDDDDAPRGELSERARSLVARIEAAQHGDAQERARAFADSTQWLEEQESLSFPHSSDLDAVIDAIAPIVDRDDPPMDWFELLLRATYFGMNALTAAPRRALDVLRRVIESGKLRDLAMTDEQRLALAQQMIGLAIHASTRSHATFAAVSLEEGERCMRESGTPLSDNTELVLAATRAVVEAKTHPTNPATALQSAMALAHKVLENIASSRQPEQLVELSVMLAEAATEAGKLGEARPLATVALRTIDQRIDGSAPQGQWLALRCAAENVLAAILLREGTPRDALAYARRSVESLRLLVERDPSSEVRCFELVQSSATCAFFLLETNQPAEARELIRDAIKIIESEPLRSSRSTLRREAALLSALSYEVRASVACRDAQAAIAAVARIEHLCSERLPEAPELAAARLESTSREFLPLFEHFHLTQQLRDSDALWLRALRARLALDPSRVEWITHLATELLEASRRDAWNAVEQRSFVHEAIALLRERFEGRDEPRVRALLSALTERESALSQSATAQPAPSDER